MNKKYNSLLFIAISFFIFLVLAKPVYTASKDFFTYQTISYNIKYKPDNKNRYNSSSCYTNPDGSIDWASCISTTVQNNDTPVVNSSLCNSYSYMANRNSTGKWRSALTSTNQPVFYQCQEQIDYHLKTFNILKASTLFLIFILLFIRYKQKF